MSYQKTCDERRLRFVLGHETEIDDSNNCIVTEKEAEMRLSSDKEFAESILINGTEKTGKTHLAYRIAKDQFRNEKTVFFFDFRNDYKTNLNDLKDEDVFVSIPRYYYNEKDSIISKDQCYEMSLNDVNGIDIVELLKLNRFAGYTGALDFQIKDIKVKTNDIKFSDIMKRIINLIHDPNLSSVSKHFRYMRQKLEDMAFAFNKSNTSIIDKICDEEQPKFIVLSFPDCKCDSTKKAIVNVMIKNIMKNVKKHQDKEFCLFIDDFHYLIEDKKFEIYDEMVSLLRNKGSKAGILRCFVSNSSYVPKFFRDGLGQDHHKRYDVVMECSKIPQVGMVSWINRNRPSEDDPYSPFLNYHVLTG